MRYTFLLAIPLALLGAQPATPQAPAMIEVRLANYKFTPSTIILDQGKSYVLRLRNMAGGGHDFTSPTFFAAATVEPADRVWIADGQVEVPPRLIRDIRLTAPAAPGRYKVRCTHAFHKMFGMSGWIIVR